MIVVKVSSSLTKRITRSIPAKSGRRNCSMKNQAMSTSLCSVQAVHRAESALSKQEKLNTSNPADHMIKINLQKPDFVNSNEV